MMNEINNMAGCNTRAQFPLLSQGYVMRLAQSHLDGSVSPQPLELRTRPLSRESVISLLDSAVAIVEEDFDELFKCNDSKPQQFGQ